MLLLFAGRLLHALFVALDHGLHHLAANGTGLLAGQVTVVAFLQVDTDLPWCSRFILSGDFGTTLHKYIDRILVNCTTSNMETPSCFPEIYQTGNERIESPSSFPTNL